ncbi:stem 28 kDa glycoprotein-like [Vigna radiata var. radiata]|uniref:Stem 28 kDa glycoprotein-like n=1 Tax=Vigna radiata var. radiata TaxID=3916 RepID=A0A1S3VD23_VIGRR|nr:stem 28 kDa glycoprotein-like [Vigna radiata var. radiata]
MSMKFVVFFVATFLVASQCYGGSFRSFPLEMPNGYGDGASHDDVRCTSWRLAVEALNILGFETVPEECVASTAAYIEGGQYQSDSKTVNQQLYFFARNLQIQHNHVVIFNIDGTALSNVAYFSQHGYGSEKFNSTLYDEFVNKGDLPALPETLKNYNKLLGLRLKIIFLSERLTDKKAVTEANLRKAGYHTWEKLILKDPSNNQSLSEYKNAERTKLEQQGYIIIANIADQWSSLRGDVKALRIFKLPNPLQFIEY